MTSKVKGQGREVTWRIWQVKADKSRTKRPRNTKIGMKVIHQWSTPVSRSKVEGQGHQADIILKPEVRQRYIFLTERPTNFKLGTHTEDEDPHQRQALWPPRSKVKVERSRDALTGFWPICRKRNITETPKLVGRLFSSRAILRTSFKVKGQRAD